MTASSVSLEDQLAIENLSARYNQAIDAGDIETWVDCFTPDGVFETQPGGSWSKERGFTELRVQGSSRLLEFGRTVASGPTVRHWSTNRVVIADGEIVRGVSYMTVFVLDGPRADELVTGMMHEELVHTADGWRFRSRRLVLDR
jgi:3-phenylpropionate/cinnamic acid dioxygenase small subunit